MHLLCCEIPGASTAQFVALELEVPEPCSPRSAGEVAVALPASPQKPGWVRASRARGCAAGVCGLASRNVGCLAGRGQGCWEKAAEPFLDLLFLVLKFVVFFVFYKTSPQEGV